MKIGDERGEEEGVMSGEGSKSGGIAFVARYRTITLVLSLNADAPNQPSR